MNSEPTLISAIIFSDSIIREAGTGKPTYIGSFDRYTLAQFPCPVPPFFVSILVTNLVGLKDLTATARIENAENGMVAGSGGAKVAFNRATLRDEVYEISIPVFNVGFPAPGKYKAVVLVNNEKIGERSLAVIHVTSTPPVEKVE